MQPIQENPALSTETINLSFNASSGVALLTFNRPDAMNAFNVPMAEEFLAAVQKIKDLPGLRCVVMQGNERAFIAGGDVASMHGSPEQARKLVNGLLDALNPAILGLRELDAPIIAAVRGVAAGAGLSISLMADIIIAESRATFLVAYDGIGAVPDCGASWALLHRLGASKANELMIMGRRLNAEEAQKLGLINITAKAADFDDVLSQEVDKIASGPSKAYASFRRLIEKASGVSLKKHMETERQAFLDITSSYDFQEGVSAFLEKRKPTFRGE